MRPPAPPAGAPGGDAPGGPDLSALLGQADPRLLRRLLPLLGELRDEGADRRARLLYALRPFLKERRREKIDQALQTARILHLGRKILEALGERDV